MEINCRNSNWRAICSPGSIKPCTNPPGLFIRNLTCRSIQNTFPTTIGIHLASMKLKHRFSTPFPCSLENSQYVRHRPIMPNHHPPSTWHEHHRALQRVLFSLRPIFNEGRGCLARSSLHLALGVILRDDFYTTVSGLPSARLHFSPGTSRRVGFLPHV